ncbi:hypothetical protein MOQ_010241, partial [Trypanosoma cruzi marinkellei]
CVCVCVPFCAYYVRVGLVGIHARFIFFFLTCYSLFSFLFCLSLSVSLSLSLSFGGLGERRERAVVVMSNFLQHPWSLLRPLLSFSLLSVIIFLLFISQWGPESSSSSSRVVVFHAGFQQIKQRNTEVWIGGPLGITNIETTLKVEWRDFDAVTIRQTRDSYLMCEKGKASWFVPRLFIDDIATSELWNVHILHDGTFALMSSGNQRYLSLGEDGNLWCNVKTINHATFWRQFMPEQSACLHARNMNDKDPTTVACWSILEAERISRRIILFGTIKPLERIEPKNASDMYDPVIITKRTLINWARLPGVQPVIFSDDSCSQRLIENINMEYAGRSGFSVIKTIHEFEMQPDYIQPTYRGLFQSVIKHYPLAKSIMYANMDILFTSSLVKTLEKVQQVYNNKKRMMRLHNKSYHGWFIVGRRINVNVPVHWSMEIENWDSEIEIQLKTLKGKIFSSDAEDYFAMNVDFFNWYKIPPFIVGGIVFDNWLTSQAVLLDITGKALTVDATKTLTAIHQNHGKNMYASLLKPKSNFNIQLLKKMVECRIVLQKTVHITHVMGVMGDV